MNLLQSNEMSPLEATGQSRRFYRQHRHEEHARFVFLHPRGAYFILGEGGKQVKKVKMTGRLKYHIRSVLSGCLCPGEMDSARPSPTLLSARTDPDRAQINAPLLRKEPQVRGAPPRPQPPIHNSQHPHSPPHPSRRVQASSYSAVIKGPPIKVNTTSWWCWGAGGGMIM